MGTWSLDARSEGWFGYSGEKDFRYISFFPHRALSGWMCVQCAHALV
mgnify:CR=1 FL=1|jgi:hypothetical protein